LRSAGDGGSRPLRPALSQRGRAGGGRPGRVRLRLRLRPGRGSHRHDRRGAVMMPAPEVTDPPLAGATRVAVVTGARGNLGAACARALLEDAYRVAAVDLFPPAPGDHPPTLARFRAAVTVSADVTRSREQIAERWRPLAIHGTVAGVARASRFAQISLIEWRHIPDVSLTRSFLIAQAFLPDMRAA